MVIEFQGVTTREAPEVEEETIPSPQISIVEADEKYGKFVLEPLDPGFGITLGTGFASKVSSSTIT